MSTNNAVPYTILPVEQLFPSPLYPFSENKDDLRQLKNSIHNNGLLQPLLVRPTQNDRYEIICGYRRMRACTQLGICELPCIVRPCSDAEALACMVIDNTHRRQQLQESEIAHTVKTLLDLCNHQGQTIPSQPLRSNRQIAMWLLLTINQVKCYARAARADEGLLELLDKRILTLSAVSVLSDIEPNIQAYIARCLQKEDAVRLTVPVAKRLVEEQKKAPLTPEQIDAFLFRQPPAASPNINISFSPQELSPYVNLHQPASDIKKDLLLRLGNAGAQYTN